jgi:hypothetical protein
MPRRCKGGSSLVERFNEKILWTYGYESKPCTPGEHQNSWYMDVHPPRYSKIGFDTSPYYDMMDNGQIVIHEGNPTENLSFYHVLPWVLPKTINHKSRKRALKLC